MQRIFNYGLEAPTCKHINLEFLFILKAITFELNIKTKIRFYIWNPYNVLFETRSRMGMFRRTSLPAN